MTKYAQFCSVSHPLKASTVVEAFVETIQKLHGILKINVNDRDPIFIGNFWTKLFSCLGTQMAHDSSCHLQSDGKTKIVNKCLEGYICFFHLISRHSGSTGFRWENDGTTYISKFHKKCTLLWHFIDIILHPSQYP